MANPHVKNLLGNAGRAPGLEVARRDGTRDYVSHRPYYEAYYFPAEQPGGQEEILYKHWQVRYFIYGWNLDVTFDQIKSNSRDILCESKGPRDPNSKEPFIERIVREIVL